MEKSTKEKKKVMVEATFGNKLEINSGTSSIEIKRNSKGETEFVVKVYDEVPAKAKETALKIFKELSKSLPFGENKGA